MTLADTFADPLDPPRSIQLNNKHWPGERFGLLGVIAEAESLVQSGGPGAALQTLQRLKPHFHGERFFGRFLGRLHRLWQFRSPFGCVTGRIDVPGEALKANEYAGAESRASYTLGRPDAFATLIRETVERYRKEYGTDFARVHCTVRFARPDDRQRDITDYGILSDFHNDEYKGISTIAYLSDVKDENGAFAFIAGSHEIPRSLVLTAIHQTVEFDMGLDSPEKLASVPLEFRGSMAIGNLLEPDKAQLVERFRQVLEGGIGTFVMFNGQYVLHRGGKPMSGTRTAAFFQPEGLLAHKLKSVSSRLFAIRHN